MVLMVVGVLLSSHHRPGRAANVAPLSCPLFTNMIDGVGDFWQQHGQGPIKNVIYHRLHLHLAIVVALESLQSHVTITQWVIIAQSSIHDSEPDCTMNMKAVLFAVDTRCKDEDVVEKLILELFRYFHKIPDIVQGVGSADHALLARLISPNGGAAAFGFEYEKGKRPTQIIRVVYILRYHERLHMLRYQTPSGVKALRKQRISMKSDAQIWFGVRKVYVWLQLSGSVIDVERMWASPT